MMLAAIRAWILLSALLVADGWILSAFHALNRTGYAISFVVAALVFVVCARPKFEGNFREKIARAARKLSRRFKRPAPLLYLLALLLSLAAALVQRPGNWDTDAYRIPRVLHWLAEGRWHWIHTGDSRMNIAAAGFEWLFTPLVLFIGNDRWLCLINIFSFACLPGLIFALFRQLKMPGRVAWWWTWNLSLGWCFAQQAYSSTNDSMAAVYVMAAILFALRAAKNGDARDWWISVLAAALLTGVKQTNLPLLLPWMIAAWQARRLWLQRPAVAILVATLGILISAVTATCLNLKYVGTWSGFPKDGGSATLTWGRQQELTSPVWGLIGNAFCFPVQNLEPPFFPFAPAWNDAMERFLKTPLGAHFTQFEHFGHLERAITSGNAGLGLIVVMVALISIWGAWRYRLRQAAVPPVAGWLWLLRLAPWVCLTAFLAKAGTYQNARQAAPYYVLLFPLILMSPGHAFLVQQRWWRWLVVLMMACTVAHLGFSRCRDFVPPTLVNQLQVTHPKSKFLSTFGDYYVSRAAVKAQREFLQTNGLSGENLVGYATTCGASEPGFWMPLGSRRVERVVAGDSLDTLRAQNMHYVVVDDFALPAPQTISQWAESYHGDVASELTFRLIPASPPMHLYLVHLRP